MGTFTIPLHEVIKLTGGTVSRDENGVAIMTGGDIGLGSLKTHIPEHREILIGKIIDHYYNREIGMETISMFQLAMRRKTQEMMPFYNKLYETELLEFNPLSTIKLHTLATGKEIQNVGVESEGGNVTDSLNKSRTVQHELPQTMLSGDGDYASSGADATTTGHVEATATESKVSDSVTDNDTETTVEGYQAYPARLVQQFRDILLNIDMMIVSQFDDCFMQIWNTGDDYDPNPRNNSWYPLV